MLGPSSFNIFSNVTYNAKIHSKVLLLVAYFNLFCTLESFEDCTQSESDTVSTPGWSSVNYMTLYQRRPTSFFLNTNLETLILLGIDFLRGWRCLAFLNYIFIATLITFLLYPLKFCGLVGNNVFSFSTLVFYSFHIFHLLEID
jgi:hypothetical protein